MEDKVELIKVIQNSIRLIFNFKVSSEAGPSNRSNNVMSWLWKHICTIKSIPVMHFDSLNIDIVRAHNFKSRFNTEYAGNYSCINTEL